jgi:hypothetical protein
VFEHEKLPWCTVVLGVLRGKHFEMMKLHGHCRPGDPIDALPDIPIRRKRKRSGWSKEFARSLFGEMR